MEVTQVLVGLADAVVLGIVRILDVGHAPRLVADELEGAGALAVLATLEAHVVVLHGLAPARGELLRCGRVDAGLAALLLDEHVVEAVVEQIDVGINGGVAPVEEQARLRESGERLVGIRVVHAVVLLFGAVQHGVVDHVATLLAVLPYVVRIPEYLRCPHAVDGRPVFIDAFSLGVREYLAAFAVVEGHARPMDEVVRLQQVDAVVVPFVRLAYTHIGRHHHVAFAVPGAGDVGVALSALDACVLLGVHDGLAAQDVLIVHAVAAHGVGRIFTTVAHVAIEVAVCSLHSVLGHARGSGQQAQCQNHCFLHCSIYGF